jgi:TetR/AcrR family transcriptional regulator, transcriptional repressor for nem operon
MIISYKAEMTNLAAGHKTSTRSRGRPREFDMDEALDRAIRVFSERGYHATSIGDLTGAMQLAAGSVYKAFKDKKAVFLAAFDRYKQVRNGLREALLREGATGRERVAIALAFYADASHGELGRQGCMVVGCAAELATFDEDVANRVNGSMRQTEALMARLIAEGQADGSISPAVDGQATARLMLCVMQGMRVLGKTGRSEAEMTALVGIAMKTLG